MLTQTSLSAIRTLLYLGLREGTGPVPPRRIASDLKESPSYLAKVTGQLVKAGLLRAYRGSLGGVTLGRSPDAITLLGVVEACQGNIVGSFCNHNFSASQTCALHHAGLELFNATVQVLSKWSLADLLHKPFPPERATAVPCWMEAGVMTRVGLAGVHARPAGRRQVMPYAPGSKTAVKRSNRGSGKR